jgi:hypothetical protein
MASRGPETAGTGATGLSSCGCAQTGALASKTIPNQIELEIFMITKTITEQ